MNGELINLISSVGFPIAVAVYLLVRLDRALQEMQRSEAERADRLAEELLSRYLELDGRVREIERVVWKHSSRGS